MATSIKPKKPRLRARQRSKIEKMSPSLQREIEDRLFKGMSPPKVTAWLNHEKNVKIGVHAVRRHWKKVAGPLAALRNTYYSRYVLGMPEKLDAYKELHRAAHVQMKRLGQGLELEQEKGNLLGIVDKGLDTLRRILQDILSIEMDLGIRERVSSGEPPKGMSDEDVKQLLVQVVKIGGKESEPATNPD